MDMLRGEQIAEANLTDWRKLAQGLHARYVVDDFGTAARFVAAVGGAGDALGHHPRVSIGDGYVDLKLVTRRRRLPRRRGHRTRRRVGDPAGRRPRATDHRDRCRPRDRGRPVLGQRDRARPRHGALRDDRAGVGGLADRERRGPGPRDSQRRDPGRHGSGAEPVVRGRRRARGPATSGSTSRSTWRPRWPSNGSPPPSPRAGPSSMTATRPCSP